MATYEEGQRELAEQVATALRVSVLKHKGPGTIPEQGVREAWELVQKILNPSADQPSVVASTDSSPPAVPQSDPAAPPLSQTQDSEPPAPSGSPASL